MSRRRRRPTRMPTLSKLLLALVLAVAWLGKSHWIAADQRPNPQPPPAAPDHAPAPPKPQPDPAPTPPPRARIPTATLEADSVWSSAAACAERIAELLSQPRPTGLRVASWNLHWFPDGRTDHPSAAGGTDVAWMACAMASLRADVIAIQEVTVTPRGRSALLQLTDGLDRLTGARWRWHLDDCPNPRGQHLGFLYDEQRLRARALRVLPSLNPHGRACSGGLRPGVAMTVDYAGAALDLVTVHLDSGVTSRDHGNRFQSVERIVQRSSREAPRWLVIGDFNTMGCSECEPPVSAIDELRTLSELAATQGQRFVLAEDPALGCSDHYDGRAVQLDHGLTDVAGARWSPAGWCAELACQRPRTTTAALQRLSDHCPIVITLP